MYKGMIKSLVKKYFCFTLGLYFLSMGIVLIVRSALGTTPISSVNYVLSLNTPLSLGSATFALNMFLILGQFWLIKGMATKKKVTEILLQIPFSFVFGLFIDVNMAITNGITPPNYFASILILIVGCLIQATGVVLEVKPNVVMMSAEGFVKYASDRYNKEFGSLKRWFDITLVVLAILASLVMAHTVQGVREGTVIAALFTGTIVTFISRHVLNRKNYQRIRARI